jgi:hypothetical protein
MQLHVAAADPQGDLHRLDKEIEPAAGQHEDQQDGPKSKPTG